MTDRLDVEDSTSSMIQLDSIRLGFIAADMLDLDILAGDINSAYIQAYTKERPTLLLDLNLDLSKVEFLL